ncbi:alpha/beta hydrolase [Niallia nealsonii]|uniref:Serine aminopeptidase S33 domain-containing protein n=1 Tax=Niallia nealsonii TaxID=115979 RepID=A0A2N0Z1C8_9BACI|nr:alpha/beta fold hydrolase [Niallia nealsonii]PKG23314.1 hypothetical protein CWS01_12760 [Niallia nealsonii]
MGERYPVMEGAESFFWQGNDIGVLISHGFMGTPQNVRYLGGEFAELGYTVYTPRLKGHGTHFKDMEKHNHKDWFADVENAYHFLKMRCSAIYVIGQSMGGTLALWLANKYKDIPGLVLINAALSVPSYDYLVGKTSPKYVLGTAPDIKLEGVQEITYNQVSIHSIHELQKLMEKTYAIIPNVKSPILCFKSAEDHVVPPENTDYIIKNAGSFQKEAVTLTNSFHVASMDHDKEEIIEKTHEYIRKNERELKLLNKDNLRKIL